MDSFGIATIERRADGVFADLFGSLTGPRPHIISLWGRPGSGRTTAVLKAARVARLAGFVPVSARVVDTIPGELFKDRSLCLLDDHDGEGRWSTLLRVALASPRGHVVLRTSADEIASLHGVGLERIECPRLIAAVRPRCLDVQFSRHVADCARRARGLPGRFAELLWRLPLAPPADTRRGHPSGFTRVAEQSAVYGDESLVPGPRHLWPVQSELASLERQVALAEGLLRGGRHAPGVRQLRQAIGGLARRQVWGGATYGARVLASALLRRGATQEAQEVLGEAERYAVRDGATATLIDVAILIGHAWIDRARLEQAEAVIGTALATARQSEDVARAARASLALARCLFWKGEYAECRSVAARAGDTADPWVKMRSALIGARAAVGLRELSLAMSLIRNAGDLASQLSTPADSALASCTAAFVHLALNDVDAAAADAQRCLTMARAGHEPIRAIRARLAIAECHRRRGHSALATRVVRRILRVKREHLPPIVHARADLLLALLERSASAAEQTEKHAERSGLPALVLYGAEPHVGGRWSVSSNSSTEALVAILQTCQRAEEETSVLRDVCTSLRRQLHASTVAVLASGATLDFVACDGPRIEHEIANRAMAAGAVVGPQHLDGRLEAATPVRYGGATIGALAARWTVGTPYDLSSASAVLTMAATAMAPVVSAVIRQRSRPVEAATGALLGTSTLMEVLRRAIGGAAAAPFAVLIEGESGSGKELVARAVHRSGPRRDRPFCTLNCAALPDDLVEAELFGHARGAYTGAVADRAGVFEEAHSGTLFLDEVGELSPRAQAKLLRVCQEGELRRLGENTSRRVDVRLVCATNRDLRREVAAGHFRLDLLYRLDVIRIAVPSLRDRREDIGLLAEHFWQEATARVGSRAVLGAPTHAALARYDWPGNVRELQNVLAALAVRAPRRGVVPPTALPPHVSVVSPAEVCHLDGARRAFEERFVRAALARCGGRRASAAAELGVTRQGLTKLLVRLGIADGASTTPGTPRGAGWPDSSDTPTERAPVP